MKEKRNLLKTLSCSDPRLSTADFNYSFKRVQKKCTDVPNIYRHMIAQKLYPQQNTEKDSE